MASERNLNPKAACLKRREEEKVEEEAPEKRAVPGVDKPFDTTGAAAGRGRGRRGRRSSRGGWVFNLVANLFCFVYTLRVSCTGEGGGSHIKMTG